MLKIGLTGGLGCGKSAVAELFAEKGVPIFDADLIARELMEPDESGFVAVVATFGESVLDNGRINRSKLRERVFAHAEDRKALEAIIHPLVYHTLARKAANVNAPYCIFDIPLLLETGRLDFVDRILVVDCHVEQQYERVKRRDSLDDETIGRMIQAQAKREERLAFAHDVIENTGAIESLRGKVESLHSSYTRLSQQTP